MARVILIFAIGILLAGCGESDDISGTKVFSGDINQLTTEKGTDPAWSPDGSEIAYIRSQNVWLISAEGGDPVQITSLNGMEINPRWNPVTGKRQLVFVYKPTPDDYKIYTLDLTGGDPVEVYSSTQTIAYPSFTHDGARIVFTTTKSKRGVMMVPVEGGEAQEIPNQQGWPGLVHCVHASPVDGTICYVEEETPEYYLKTVPIEGGTPTVWAHVTQDPDTRNDISYAAFSRDGSQIVLLVRGQIMVIESPGQELLQLTHRRQDGYFYYPNWSPDGKRMACNHSNQVWILTIQ